MNEDVDEMAAEPLAGEPLERALGRYARVRLDPSPAQARRARAAIVEAAWRQRLAQPPAGAERRRPLFAAWSSRRLAASLSAAVLAGLLLGTSAFAASRAGGPLYETRLALEAVTLPADAAARVDAQVTAAQARLAEAVEAAGRGDAPATVAALAAYDQVIDELASADGEAAQRALEAIAFHHEVLVDVASRVPAAATAGLDRALANTERVMDRLADETEDPGAVNGGGPGGANGAGGQPGAKPTPQADPTAKPTKEPATPKPTKEPATPKPTKEPATPKPEKTEAPAPTERPGRTPPPRPTPPDEGAERPVAPTEQP